MQHWQALKLANRREHSSTNASALPQQLAMTDGGAERCVLFPHHHCVFVGTVGSCLVFADLF
jgi:hypothetical protein